MSISLQHTKAQKMLFCFPYPHCRSLSFWAALCTSGCWFGAFFTQLICDLWGKRTAAHPARRPKLPPLFSSVRLLGRRALRKHCTARASALLYPYIRHRQVPSKGEQKRERGKKKKEKKRKNLLSVHMACMHPCNALLGVPNYSNGSLSFPPICDLRVWGGEGPTTTPRFRQ